MAERALADAKDLVKWNCANLLKAMNLIDAPRLQLQAGMERLGFSPAAAAATGYALEFVFAGGIKTVGSAAVRSGVKATVKTAAKKGSGFTAGGVARGGASVVRVGQAGEAAVRSVADIGEKALIRVGGRGRIPDWLTSTLRSEVKNVGSLSDTQQLRDFATYASQRGLRFDLWVSPTTQPSGPLVQEVANRAINLRYIP